MFTFFLNILTLHAQIETKGMLTHMCNSITNGTFWTPENVTKIGFGFGVTWLVGFTQILHEEQDQPQGARMKSPFSTSPGTVTRT